MKNQLGVVVGMLRVVAIQENPPNESGITDGHGVVTLRCRGIDGEVEWPVSETMIRRIRIGDELWIEAPEFMFEG